MPRLLLALCVALCAFPVFAQEKQPAKQPPAADLLATILKLEKEVVDLFQKRKTDLLQKLLADDFVEVTSEGRRDKAAVFKELEALRDEPLDETIVTISDAKVSLVTPDAALLTYRLEIKDAPAKDPKAPPAPPAKSEPKAPPKKAEAGKDPAKAGEQPAAGEASEPLVQFISSVWVKRNGKWVNVFYQSTPASEDADE